MIEHAAELLTANDLVTAAKRIVEVRPDSDERFVLLTLMRAIGVVEVGRRRSDDAGVYLTPIDFATRYPASAPKAASATPRQPSPLQKGSGLTQPVTS